MVKILFGGVKTPPSKIVSIKAQNILEGLGLRGYLYLKIG